MSKRRVENVGYGVQRALLWSHRCSGAIARGEDNSLILFIAVVVRHSTASPPHFTDSPLHHHPIAPRPTVILASPLCSPSCALHGHRCCLPTWEAQRLLLWPPYSATLSPACTRASHSLVKPLMLGNIDALRKHPRALAIDKARPRRGRSTRTKPVQIRSLPRPVSLAEQHIPC